MWLYVPSACCPSAPDSLASSSVSSLRSVAERLGSSVLLRSKPTSPKFWLGAWKKGRFLLLLFGAMSGPSELSRFAGSWISSLQATAVSRSHRQVFDSVSEILATSGPISPASSESADLLSSSLRTFPAMPPSDSIGSEQTWKRWVTALRRSSRELLKSAPRICASASSGSPWPTTTTTSDAKAGRKHGYMLQGNPGTTLTDAVLDWAEEVGLYPTPDAAVSNDGESPESWRRRRQQARQERYAAATSGPKAGNGAGVPLAIVAKEFTRDNLYATPVASERANRTQKIVPSVASGRHGRHLSVQAIELAREQLYPTPRASDWKAGQDVKGTSHVGGPNLRKVALETVGSLPSLPGDETSKDGERISRPALVLNPRFSEALMGLPRGWTSSERLGMESFRRWWRLHSGF